MVYTLCQKLVYYNTQTYNGLKIPLFSGIHSRYDMINKFSSDLLLSEKPLKTMLTPILRAVKSVF
jgi:hypothetical protein